MERAFRELLDDVEAEHVRKVRELVAENSLLRDKIVACKHKTPWDCGSVHSACPANENEALTVDSVLVEVDDQREETEVNGMNGKVTPERSDDDKSFSAGWQADEPEQINGIEVPRKSSSASSLLVGEAPAVCFELTAAWKERKFEDRADSSDNLMGMESYHRPHSMLVRRPVAVKPSIRHGPKASKEINNQLTTAMFVIPPNCSFRVAWDLIGLVLIGYDLLAIPFTTAFNPKPVWFMIGMDYTALGFWTCDMLQAFFLGYYNKGTYVTDHRRILLNYLVSWFAIDLLVVGPEWVTVFDGNSNSLGGLGRMLRASRAIRILRLVRLLKLQRIINMLYDMIESEYAFILVNLAKLLVSVLILNHVIACCWFGLGRVTRSAGQQNWIDHGNFGDSLLWYKYTTSLHWSLTQFTPASVDISARNTAERVFSIVVLFFAMVAFSSIIGSISSSMTSLRNMKNDEMKQFWLLRRYLRQRTISSCLSGRIVKYLEHQSSKQSTMVQSSSIKIMSGLSEALTNELTYQLHSPVLLGHMFFQYLDSDMQVVMHRLCRFVLKAQSYAEGEVCFSTGEESRRMFFIKCGDLVYISLQGVELDPPPQVHEGVGEAVLWGNWRHCGELVALTTCELLVLDPASFVDVMSLHPRPWFYAKRYAEQFIEFLNVFGPSELSDILRNTEAVETMVREAVRTEKGLASEMSPSARPSTTAEILPAIE
eukprot:TRINITY_DN39328_c0_g1_i2.p1 TRINITY_DN39328_c0_g1~~TRINITY_DN39328_c0_g1_i2.p1  ORF type:complete len:711 (-),score=109.47 TRINITY_DN39328_c0_g1_i2:65-2197(-)